MWKRIVFISGDAACSVRAETTALWQFDDGVPAVAATALVTEVNAPALNGAASQIGTGSNPVHSDDRPGVRIWSRYGGALLNTSNSASLHFVNTGLPAVTNSSSGGVITVPDNDPLLRASNLTVEAFIKVDRHINWPLIIAKPRADGNGATWNLLLDNAGKLMLRFDTQPFGTGSGSGYNQTWSGTTSLEDGRWHHVAFTYSHTDRAVKGYVDYVEAISKSTFSNLVYDTSPLRIGQGAGAVAFDGWIDEIRISDQVLQPDQFMYAAESADTSTRGYWTFDDGTSALAAGILTNTFNAPFLYGTASAINGGAVKPAFSLERPPATTWRISDGKGGPQVNENSVSLLFVNGGLPGNISSGNGGAVTVSGTALPAQMSNFTAEAFIRANRFVSFPQLMGKARPDVGGVCWWLGLSSNSNLLARFDTQIPPGTSGNNQTFTTTALVGDGRWHHVALTYDYTSKAVKLYKDYEKVREGTTTNPMWLDTGDIRFGGSSGGSTHSFDGWIDEVRLSDRVLTPDEFLRTVPVKGTLMGLN